MEILKILEESGRELYEEDLDFFETELATGESYDEEYQEKCREKIHELRVWLNEETTDEHKENKPVEENTPVGMVVNIDDLAPIEVNPVAAALTLEERIFKDIESMRSIGSYKSSFKNYVAEKDELDACFVDKHYSFFEPWELDAIISVKQMGEEFIEKYFNVLDHDKIARYQCFSEDFFIKHFTQMNTDVVLKQGKNEWRKKENRSKQLSVFLRLKGVRG